MVFAGSFAAGDETPSAKGTHVERQRRQLEELGVLIRDATGLRFTRDHRFDSHSGAAMAVIGSAANEWVEWRNEDGRTLGALIRGEPGA